MHINILLEIIIIGLCTLFASENNCSVSRRDLNNQIQHLNYLFFFLEKIVYLNLIKYNEIKILKANRMELTLFPNPLGDRVLIFITQKQNVSNSNEVSFTFAKLKKTIFIFPKVITLFKVIFMMIAMKLE